MGEAEFDKPNPDQNVADWFEPTRCQSRLPVRPVIDGIGLWCKEDTLAIRFNRYQIGWERLMLVRFRGRILEFVEPPVVAGKEKMPAGERQAGLSKYKPP
jgi:hypothetical protein